MFSERINEQMDYSVIINEQIPKILNRTGSFDCFQDNLYQFTFWKMLFMIEHELYWDLELMEVFSQKFFNRKSFSLL